MGIDEPLMETTMPRFLRALPIALAAMLCSPHASAETIVHYREGQRVEATEVARLLAPRTRSIRLLDDPAPAAAAAPSAAVSVASAAPTLVAHVAPPADTTGLSLPVRFAFGSAEILPIARAQLDAVAAGIKLLPAETVITIEGHTDAVGSDAYNLVLSRERARSVRDYLVGRHGIDASHLKTAGYGEFRPIDGSDPHDGVNRRVEFRGS